MKVLLVSQNPVIKKLVSVASKRLNLDIEHLSVIPSGFDPKGLICVIVDDENVSSNFNTLMLLQNHIKVCLLFGRKSQVNKNDFNIAIQKPFLPTDILEILSQCIPRDGSGGISGVNLGNELDLDASSLDTADSTLSSVDEEAADLAQRLGDEGDGLDMNVGDLDLSTLDEGGSVTTLSEDDELSGMDEDMPSQATDPNPVSESSHEEEGKGLDSMTEDELDMPSTAEDEGSVDFGKDLSSLQAPLDPSNFDLDSMVDTSLGATELSASPSLDDEASAQAAQIPSDLLLSDEERSQLQPSPKEFLDSKAEELSFDDLEESDSTNDKEGRGEGEFDPLLDGGVEGEDSKALDSDGLVDSMGAGLESENEVLETPNEENEESMLDEDLLASAPTDSAVDSLGEEVEDAQGPSRAPSELDAALDEAFADLGDSSQESESSPSPTSDAAAPNRKLEDTPSQDASLMLDSMLDDLGSEDNLNTTTASTGETPIEPVEDDINDSMPQLDLEEAQPAAFEEEAFEDLDSKDLEEEVEAEEAPTSEENLDSLDDLDGSDLEQVEDSMDAMEEAKEDDEVSDLAIEDIEGGLGEEQEEISQDEPVEDLAEEELEEEVSQELGEESKDPSSVFSQDDINRVNDLLRDTSGELEDLPASSEGEEASPPAQEDLADTGGELEESMDMESVEDSKEDSLLDEEGGELAGESEDPMESSGDLMGEETSLEDPMDDVEGEVTEEPGAMLEEEGDEAAELESGVHEAVLDEEIDQIEDKEDALAGMAEEDSGADSVIEEEALAEEMEDIKDSHEIDAGSKDQSANLDDLIPLEHSALPSSEDNMDNLSQSAMAEAMGEEELIDRSQPESSPKDEALEEVEGVADSMPLEIEEEVQEDSLDSASGEAIDEGESLESLELDEASRDGGDEEGELGTTLDMDSMQEEQVEKAMEEEEPQELDEAIESQESTDSQQALASMEDEEASEVQEELCDATAEGAPMALEEIGEEEGENTSGSQEALEEESLENVLDEATPAAIPPLDTAIDSADPSLEDSKPVPSSEEVKQMDGASFINFLRETPIDKLQVILRGASISFNLQFDEKD